jgi:ribosomal-protein-alanine N-acetyltransferase
MHNAVLGYDLLPEFWHQGYAAEAVYAALNAGFSGALHCGVLHRVQADTIPGNQASEALLRRLGFQEEGLRRGAGYWKNSFHDLKCFGLLRAEFLQH